MDLRSLITRQKIMNALQTLSNLRVAVSRSTLLTISALTLIFFIALSIRLLPMRWGLELSEFDPYFQFQFTEKIVEDGYTDWLTWTTRESNRWYPLEVSVARQAFPGLPMTAATIYNILFVLGVPIQLYYFCILFPAIFGAFACLMAFFVGRDVGGKAVGLLSSLFLALNSSHITRTSAGFFDDETVGIGAILLFVFLFLRAIDKDRPEKPSVVYATAAGLTMGYIIASWGAALYPVAMTALFVLVLIVIRRYTRRLLLSYSITFGLGLFIAINVPKNSIGYLRSWAVLPVLGVFALLCLSEILKIVRARRNKIILTTVFLLAIIGGFIVLSSLGYLGSIAGKFVGVINPLQRQESQIYQSVQEHRLTAWGSIYYDYGAGILFFLVGMFFAIRDLTNRNLFILIFGLTALYFASSMVRLTILLAPAFTILMAIGIVNLLRPFIAVMKKPPRISAGRKYITGHVGREFSGSVLILVFLLLTLTFSLPSPRMYNHAYSPPTILTASVPIQPTEAITEWTASLNWMKLNLPPTSVICSWWDYGYWITVRGNQTSLADNATFNTTHISLIGRVFMSNETVALKILEDQFNGPDGPPTHILAFTTFYRDGVDGGFGDEGKWRWMARIANSVNATTQLYSEEGVGWNYTEWNGGTNTTLGFATQTAEENARPYFEWNSEGQTTIIYKIMAAAKQYRGAAGTWWAPPADATEFQYLQPAYFSEGIDLGGLYAIVAIFEINYQQYELDLSVS